MLCCRSQKVSDGRHAHRGKETSAETGSYQCPQWQLPPLGKQGLGTEGSHGTHSTGCKPAWTALVSALMDSAHCSPLLSVVVIATILIAPDTHSSWQRGANSLLTGPEKPVAKCVH